MIQVLAMTMAMAAFAPPLVAVGPEALVQQQVDAYNAHDLDAMVACYGPGIEFWTMDGKVRGEKGVVALRAGYAELFKKFPKVKVKVLTRICQGTFVIDQQQADGMGQSPITVTAIYETAQGKIVRVWYIGG